MGYSLQPQGPRFSFRPDKTAEAISVIAAAAPGATTDFVKLCLYLADKEHFLDWGRPISFDRYAATADGPEPLSVRNMLLAATGMTWRLDPAAAETALEHAAVLTRLVAVERHEAAAGAHHTLFAVEPGARTPHLSATDIECLTSAVAAAKNDSYGFDCARHKDEAWREAWDRARVGSAEINVLLWADPHERAAFAAQLVTYAAHA